MKALFIEITFIKSTHFVPSHHSFTDVLSSVSYFIFIFFFFCTIKIFYFKMELSFCWLVFADVFHQLQLEAAGKVELIMNS